MRNRMGRVLFAIVGMAGLLPAGCASTRSAARRHDPPLSEERAAALRAETRLLEEQSGCRDSLLAAIESLRMLTASPSPADRYRAHVGLAHLQLLFGDGYVTGTRRKSAWFREALYNAEAALSTHPEFRARVESGDRVWEASEALGASEMDALFFWVTAVLYRFKEGQNPLGQVINFRWVQRAHRVLEQMTAIDPDWGNGALHFTWGLYYLSLPERVGGDRERSAACFERANEVGPNVLMHRWGRAKYFHVRMNNPRGFTDDLEWVLTRDPADSPEHPAWRAFFRQDARRLLENRASLF